MVDRTKKKRPPTRNSYWMYGAHACEAALCNPAREILRVVMTTNAQERFGSAARGRTVMVENVPPPFFSKILPFDAVHQGIAMEVQPLTSCELEEIDSDAPIVMLDQVSDPHNVGAILRSAAAFGAAAVIVTENQMPKESGALAKSASGALDIVPLIVVANLAQAIEDVKRLGYWCMGMDGDAKQTLQEAKPTKKTALIMGSEGKGLRRLTAERCDFLVKLSISPQMESLNVSNAAAIALSEIYVRG